jgi:hypothetical protein
MSHTLTLELSDQVFTVIQQQAEAMGLPPERLAATLLEQRFGQMFQLLLSDADRETARFRFERHFGELNLSQSTDIDNESIDADIAREYASNHEVE